MNNENYYIKFTPQQLNNVLTFLNRSSLTGEEAEEMTIIKQLIRNPLTIDQIEFPVPQDSIK